MWQLPDLCSALVPDSGPDTAITEVTHQVASYGQMYRRCVGGVKVSHAVEPAANPDKESRVRGQTESARRDPDSLGLGCREWRPLELGS